MPADRIYHYTDRLSATDVRREGLLKAFPLTLHRDMMGRDRGQDTLPVVWFTTSPEPDRTVLAKLQLFGWPMPPVGDLFRFVLAADYPHAELWPTEAGVTILGCEPIWWQWCLTTAAMAQSDPAEWRLCRRDVPAADWMAVEVLTASGWEAKS